MGFGQVRPWSWGFYTIDDNSVGDSDDNKDDKDDDNHHVDDDADYIDDENDDENDDDTFIILISLSTLKVSTSLGSAFLQIANNEYFAELKIVSLKN